MGSIHDPEEHLGVVAAIAGAAIGLSIAAVRLIDKFLFRKNDNSTAIICPNKVEELPNLVSKVDSHVRRVEDVSRVIARDVSLLRDQHKADDSGVERWKIQPEFKQTMEDARDTQREVLGELKKLKELMRKMVELQAKTHQTLSGKSHSG